MEQDYEKERSAALIKEAKALTAELKVEVGNIQTQMGRVLQGDEDEFLVGSEGEKSADDASILESVVPRKSFWRFWR